MMTIDMALVVLLISLILSVLAGGVFIGRLSEKVKHNRADINYHQEEVKEALKENEEEHRAIINKLDAALLRGRE